MGSKSSSGVGLGGVKSGRVMPPRCVSVVSFGVLWSMRCWSVGSVNWKQSNKKRGEIVDKMVTRWLGSLFCYYC